MKCVVLWVLLLSVCSYGAYEIKTWTLMDGSTFEARYKTTVGGNVIMENQKGAQKKVPLDRFTPDDIEFFELENPPEFKLNFKNKSTQLQYDTRYELRYMPVILLYEYGASAEKRSAGKYDHEVTIEFFAIAAQRGHNHKFVLVDRQSASFVPSKENDYKLEFWSPRIVEIDEYSFNNLASRGKKDSAFLIIVKDKRGKVIATKASKDWLLENVEELRKRSIGNFIDETCQRVYPGRPFPDRGNQNETTD